MLKNLDWQFCCHTLSQLCADQGSPFKKEILGRVLLTAGKREYYIRFCPFCGKKQ